MNPSITTDDLSRYHEEGHLILREAFSSDRILSLRDALERLMDRALAGEIEIGWINQERRLFSRTGHLMSPDRYDPAYGDWLAEDLDPHLQTLLGATPRHSLFGTLACGGGQPYKQAWHRDLGRPGADDEAEYYRRHHGTFVQFNAPILPGDRFLNIVPASHLRASTPAEIGAAAAGAVSLVVVASAAGALVAAASDAAALAFGVRARGLEAPDLVAVLRVRRGFASAGASASS